MTQSPVKKPQPPAERSQAPLWLSIVGLVISIFSFSMADMMMGDVVFYFGAFMAVMGMLYWILQPKHGL